MRAEIWRLSAVLGGFGIVGLVAFPLTASFLRAWTLVVIAWTAFLFAFLVYVAYEQVAYPREPASESDLFHQVKAIQDSKARVMDLSQERARRRGGKAGQAGPQSVSPSPESQCALVPVPDRRRYPRLEIPDTTTAAAALDVFAQ